MAATEAPGWAPSLTRAKSGSYLQRGVKDDQFGAGGHGIIAGVFLHEVHVDLGPRLLQLIIPTQAEKRGLWGWAGPRPVLPQTFELTVPGLWVTRVGTHC